MPINSLSVTDVGPFDEVTLEFHPQVNVLTGPNNSGKSTLLWVLAELLVYPFTMPAKSLRSDQATWKLITSSPSGDDSVEGNLPTPIGPLLKLYETIGYTCYVPGQRNGTNFRSAGPTVVEDVDARIYEELALFSQDLPVIARQGGIQALRTAWRSSINHLEPPELVKRRSMMLVGSSLVDDRAVKQKIVNLDYASYRENRPAIKSTIAKVVSMASEITEGYQMRFLGVGKDSEGLFPQISTLDGDLPLDVLSQGTQSIIQFLARLVFGYAEYYDFPPSLEEKQGVFIIDEIDAHLHPTWQRRIIPTLTRHFPNLQIFCSTHSPLMLAGLKTGQIQLLRRNENGKVTVSRNESDIVGWTADEILRQFMATPSPTDEETARRVRRFQELMRKEELSTAESEELNQLRTTVRDDLLSGPMSAQVLQFAEELRRAGAELIPTVSPSTNDQEAN